MAPRGVCAHLPCVGGEFSSKATSECSSEEPAVGEWDRRRRYRQLVHQQAGRGHYQGGGGGHYRQLVDQKGHYRHPGEAGQSRGQYKQLKDLSHLVDCSNEHILLPTDTYPENGDIVDDEKEEEEESLPLEIAAHFLVDSTNLYAKVRPKNRRCKLQQLEVSERPRNFDTFQKTAATDHQHQLMAHTFAKRPPENFPKTVTTTALSSIPESSLVLSPTISATDARLAQLRREMSARSTGSKPGREDSRAAKKVEKAVQQNPPLPRLPPVCGRSPPCHCPEDRELAAKLRLRIVKKISTLRRKHLRLRVIFKTFSRNLAKHWRLILILKSPSYSCLRAQSFLNTLLGFLWTDFPSA